MKKKKKRKKSTCTVETPLPKVTSQSCEKDNILRRTEKLRPSRTLNGFYYQKRDKFGLCPKKQDLRVKAWPTLSSVHPAAGNQCHSKCCRNTHKIKAPATLAHPGPKTNVMRGAGLLKLRETIQERLKKLTWPKREEFGN